MSTLEYFKTKMQPLSYDAFKSIPKPRILSIIKKNTSIFMNKYLLNDYNLSKYQVLQSLFLSDYGLRHWNQAKQQPEQKWGHRFLAIMELCPLLGFVATIVEAIIARSILPNYNANVDTWQTHTVQVLFSGNQNNCQGSVDSEKSKEIVNKLNANPVDGIQFSPEQIGSSVSGGTCTAMSLAFLNSYFQVKNENTGTLMERLIRIGKDFQTSSPEMRDRQAAYNTIRVTQTINDPLKNKVQALANHLGFKMDYNSDSIDFNPDMQKTIKSLPEGAFLIRMIKPSINEKLEEHGHSLVYIKDRDAHFFYDPNYGLKKIHKTNYEATLKTNLKLCVDAYDLNKVGFYRFLPPESLDPNKNVVF